MGYNGRNTYSSGGPVKRHILVTSLLSLLLAAPTAATAQGRPPIEGNIEMEEGEVITPYAAAQKAAITTFQTLADAAAKGGPFQKATLSENTLSFLNGVYLLCTIEKGKCPTVLDAVLELDIINSKLQGTADCPLMRSFWKLWLKQDMQRRQDFMGKPALLHITTEFQRNERPKYVKCSPTVKEEIAGASEAQTFLKNRFSEKNPFTDATKLLQEVKKKVPNIFIAVGAGGVS
jgi:hypothetical protein